MWREEGIRTEEITTYFYDESSGRNHWTSYLAIWLRRPLIANLVVFIAVRFVYDEEKKIDVYQDIWCKWFYLWNFWGRVNGFTTFPKSRQWIQLHRHLLFSNPILHLIINRSSPPLYLRLSIIHFATTSPAAIYSPCRLHTQKQRVIRR